MLPFAFVFALALALSLPLGRVLALLFSFACVLALSSNFAAWGALCLGLNCAPTLGGGRPVFRAPGDSCWSKGLVFHALNGDLADVHVGLGEDTFGLLFLALAVDIVSIS